MGYGDLIMAAGQAQELYTAHPELGPVALLAGDSGKIRWRDLWEGNPAIYKPIAGAVAPRAWIRTGKGYLPYLDNERSTAEQWVWSGWQARDHRGSIYLARSELAATALYDRPFILVEPPSDRKHVNRRPATEFWDDLVDGLHKYFRHYPLLQLGHREALRVHGLVPVSNPSFRSACAVLSRAALLVCTEGGLAHAAAALGIPALVLWGGNISYDALGYPEHMNLLPLRPHLGCGRLTPCPACTSAWQDYSADAVLAAISAYTAPGGGADGIPRFGQRADGHDLRSVAPTR